MALFAHLKIAYSPLFISATFKHLIFFISRLVISSISFKDIHLNFTLQLLQFPQGTSNSAPQGSTLWFLLCLLPSLASIVTSLTLLLPTSTFKDPCDYIGPTQTIRGNFPISRSLITFTKSFFLPHKVAQETKRTRRQKSLCSQIQILSGPLMTLSNY